MIGLAPNLFYGTGIPACILILRSPDGHREHAGEVLFINADRDFIPGRAQNQLGFEHAEKIVTVYRQWREIDRYSRVVRVRNLLAADANLTFAAGWTMLPRPSRQDVRSHLHGGVPKVEVVTAEGIFAAFGIRADDLFASTERAAGYLDFLPEGPEATASRLPSLAQLGRPSSEQHTVPGGTSTSSSSLSFRIPVNSRRSAPTCLTRSPRRSARFGILDEFAAAGVVASWWGETLYDLKSLAAGGFSRVVEGWAASIEAMLAPEPGPDGKLKTKPAAERRKALDHKLVPHLLRDYLAELEEAEAAYAAADAAYKEALNALIGCGDLRRG